MTTAAEVEGSVGGVVSRDKAATGGGGGTLQLRAVSFV